MATRTISISEDAYKRLASLKRDNESFSLVIKRITGGSALSKIQGILSRESADKLEEEIKKRAKVIKWMSRKKIKDYKKVGIIINLFYTSQDFLLNRIEGKPEAIL